MEFPAKMAKLTEEQRLSFYEGLAHDLTVAIRCVWSNQSITDAEKVDRIKWVNEILHGVTAKVRVLRTKSHEWTEENFGQMIRHCVNQCPGITQVVYDSLNRSYRQVTGEDIVS